MSNQLRTRLLALTAAAAGSLGLAPAASAVPVTVTPPSFMSEGSPMSFRFETPSVRDKVAPGSTVTIYASYDNVFDPAVDGVIATATFTDLLSFTYVQGQVNDRVANPGGAHVWTFFYVPSAGIELNTTSHSIAVDDEDDTKQGFLSSSLWMKGRTLETSYTFMEPQASGTLRIKLGKKTIAKKKLSNKTDATKTVKVKIRIGAKNYSKLRKKKKVTITFTGSSAARDLAVSGTYKLRR